MSISLGQSVRHRTLGSAAQVRNQFIHTRLTNNATIEQFPVLEVLITLPALKSHHKEGDIVLWAEEDVIG